MFRGVLDDKTKIINVTRSYSCVRFGNLLLETATLLLVGRRVNLPVNLLPQVDRRSSCQLT